MREALCLVHRLDRGGLVGVSDGDQVRHLVSFPSNSP
jgi:hypothetical protein